MKHPSLIVSLSKNLLGQHNSKYPSM